ncbi:hypothetical protein C8R42DRAFT_762911 [Lentinula raphanica]|nr:hypothetical protein C8R42DRAFT_762911 [Lentinula raphanica]
MAQTSTSTTSARTRDARGRYNLRRGPSQLQTTETISNAASNSENDGNKENSEELELTYPSDEEHSAGTVKGNANRNVDENPNPWVTVGPHCRAHSLNSIDNNNRNLNENIRLKPVEPRAENKGRQAKKPVPLPWLKELLYARLRKISRKPNLSDLNDEPTVNPNKGKGVDPRNWGAVNIPESEADVDAQRAALESLKSHRDDGNVPEPQPEKTVKKKSSKKSKSSKQRAGSEALTDQVESHIPDIVEQRARKSNAAAPKPTQNPMDRVPDKSKKHAGEQPKKDWGDLPDHLPAPPALSQALPQMIALNRIVLILRKKSKKMILKPDPPEPYDGSVDVNAFIKPKMALTCRKFSVRSQMNNSPAENKISAVLASLMNERRSISYGLVNRKIQKGLWSEKLNPELSTYNQVASTAELLEIIENIDPEEPKKKTDKSEKSKGAKTGGNTSSVQQSSLGKGNGKNNGRNFKPNNSKPHNQRRELTDKEKDEYRASGCCFQCGVQGHMSRQCPEGKSVPLSSSSGGPLGIASNHVGIDTERLRTLAETTEEITGLGIGMMSIEHSDHESWDRLSDTTHDSMPSLQALSESEESEYEINNDLPTWDTEDLNELYQDECRLGPNYTSVDHLEQMPKKRRFTSRLNWMYHELNHPNYGYASHPLPSCIDDMISQRTMYLLDSAAPYPTDEDQKQEFGRFYVYPISDKDYCISDSDYFAVEHPGYETLNGCTFLVPV